MLSVALGVLLGPSHPVAAGSLVISPHTIELEVAPGTSATVMLSLENGLGSSYTFHLFSTSGSNLRDGYTHFPDVSSLRIDPEDFSLAPGERRWVSVTISIPDELGLEGQRWQANIEISCQDEPLLTSEVIILVTVPHPYAPTASWATAGGIILTSLTGILFWNWHSERARNKWTTGLKRKHWIK